MKYSVGDKVVYGTHGVCEVLKITSERIGSDLKDYYLLCPLSDSRSKIYVPCDNENLVSRMREILSPAEIDRVIDSVEPSGMEWISNNIKRKEICASVLKNGDHRRLMELVTMMYLKQAEMREQKKRFNVTDERFLRDAERIIADEFSFSLGIELSEVGEYIRNRLKKA